jgi:hypothetical protein
MAADKSRKGGQFLVAAFSKFDLFQDGQVT